MTAIHPLDPLSPAELEAAIAAARAHHGSDRLRFVTITLKEPAKDVVAAWAPGAPVERVAELVLLDPDARRGVEADLDVATGAVLRWDDLGERQPAIIPEEYELVERQLKADPRFQAAMEKRGVPLDLVAIDPCMPGKWPDDDFEGRRVCRSFAWMLPTPDGNQYARPIEGVTGMVDLHTGEVLYVHDLVDVPVPQGDGDFRAAGPDDAHRPQADRDHATRGRELRGRGQPRPLAEVVVPHRLDGARGARAPHGRLRRRRARPGRSSTAPRSARWPCPTATRATTATRRRRSTSART